jgi:hypothetical protein
LPDGWERFECGGDIDSCPEHYRHAATGKEVWLNVRMPGEYWVVRYSEPHRAYGSRAEALYAATTQPAGDGGEREPTAEEIATLDRFETTYALTRLRAERDALRARVVEVERDLHEQHQDFARELAAALAERDQLRQERDAAVAERDAIAAETRATDPIWDKLEAVATRVLGVQEQIDAAPTPAPDRVRVLDEYETAVANFAKVMLAKLRANADKGHWRYEGMGYLLRRLSDESGELKRDAKADPLSPVEVMKEAADVANFAMMIAECAAWCVSGKDNAPADVCERALAALTADAHGPGAGKDTP